MAREIPLFIRVLLSSHPTELQAVSGSDHAVIRGMRRHNPNPAFIESLILFHRARLC